MQLQVLALHSQGVCSMELDIQVRVYFVEVFSLLRDVIGVDFAETLPQRSLLFTALEVK
jgi:hypothetical protein